MIVVVEVFRFMPRKKKLESQRRLTFRVLVMFLGAEMVVSILVRFRYFRIVVEKLCQCLLQALIKACQ